MDPVSGAKAAANTLKGAQTAGKELGSVVTSQQADMESAVQRQHQARIRARIAEEKRSAMLEVRAVQKYEQQKSHEREIERIKQDTVRRYGKNSWIEVESLKAKLQKEEAEEFQMIDHDRQRQMQAFWWCCTAAALITYFFKLYKS